MKVWSFNLFIDKNIELIYKDKIGSPTTVNYAAGICAQICTSGTKFLLSPKTANFHEICYSTSIPELNDIKS